MGVNGIYGLSSGMDVDSLVKQSMQAKQKQYDSMYKKEQAAEWTKDAYNQWYDKLSDFQNNTIYKYSLSSGMAPKMASSSNSSVVTATAGGGAANISHNVTINSMSSNAYLKSTTGIDRISGESGSIKLSDILGLSNIDLKAVTGETSASDKLTFTKDGVDYELTGSQMDETAISFTLRDGTISLDTNTDTEVRTNQTISFSYRDLAEGTLNDLANKISNSGTDISGNYDTVNDSFSIYNKKGGEGNFIDLTVDTIALPGDLPAGLNDSTANTQTLLNALKLGSYNVATDTLGTAMAGTDFSATPANPGDATGSMSASALSGTSGSVKIDGREYKTDSNQIMVDGVTYNLVSKGTGSTTVSVTTDTDTIVKNVNEFVDKYNELLKSLKSDVNTAPDKNYTALTDDEKKEMSDDQVKSWTEKAKKGLLYKDSPLSSLIDDMRSAVNQPISGIGGKYNSLANLGIGVSADWNNDKSGLLSVDEEKLRKALADDPDAVYKVFNNPAADDDSNTFGVVKRLNSALTDAIGKGDIATASGIRGQAGVTDSSNISDQSNWGNEIANWKKKMAAFQDEMDKYQDQLYKQFDAMETAISNQNSQYSYISSFLGGS
ncbi:flagellar filament capping protein FliD [Pectinatus brassicae]|uniref:Flagellar hook-associated protein 2 n=1 Tax=Pectinatus brassicae TaxID=862415 RepID=A0A840URR1_9FIRM|nr:flagellar filament capping protein FliD [Pectinatus brassicae]MBB5336832.1 flagellar hook-associated protein 2 [Pectinatus brassicae]